MLKESQCKETLLNLRDERYKLDLETFSLTEGELSLANLNSRRITLAKMLNISSNS